MSVAGTAMSPRARDLGIPFPGSPGPLNAITDVGGITVGQVTVISDDVGPHAARTGVTIIHPRGSKGITPVFAAVIALNGVGEMTGSLFVNEEGFLEGPIGLTNSTAIGTVRDAIGATARTLSRNQLCTLPLVAETFDGYLNDIFGGHVTVDIAIDALTEAASGPVAEGNVGGGTGMILFGFKGGIGTASRRVRNGVVDATIGVLVQGNCGRREQLRIAGLCAGHDFSGELDPEFDVDQGSIIIIVATDAPLLPHQLARVAKRTAIGLGLCGAIMAETSGDIAIAFSTANPEITGLTMAPARTDVAGATTVAMLPNAHLNPIFVATIEATHEAVFNAMVAAKPMHGRDGRFVGAINHDAIRHFLARHNLAFDTS